uniref:Putative reverse transcriptase domain-containing protein n=1 Tax=Tanacetum cinerariifolium TaxID=118510 RepID=A0A699V7I9_TANCI|nr:putative reverse transcriptase domain-containing protein [Tanacetum cinerariifolium]
MFQISECKEKDRVKFAMATLYGRALTWWTGRTKAIGIKAANNTPWSEVIEEVVVIIDERKTAVRTRGEVMQGL